MPEQEKLSAMDKAYDPKQCEDRIYDLWEKSGFFNPDNLSKDGQPFVISMPPPNATGVLHLGHAAGLAYEDLMIRYQRLKGRQALWLPGTDHAAIATQTRVEKILAKEGTDRHQLGREKFLARVREFVAQSQGTIRQQTKKMGSSCDWSRERYTFDDALSVAVNQAFIQMYQDGLIYQGERIVNWCPRCQSTLADDEVEYQPQTAQLYYIQYGPLLVATTRPETKLADTGVAVNPYDKRYKAYIGQELEVSLAGHKLKVKVFADKEVDKDFGSGAVGVTPAHSATDHSFAQKHGLEIIKLIDEEGNILPSGGQYQGLTALAARAALLKDLEKAGQLVKVEDLENNLSVCYRCQTPIEPLLSKQWFVAVDKKIPGRNQSLKELAFQAVKSGQIKILPERFAKIYFHWINNLHDWCISRQIWWGHRIPVYYTENREVIVAASLEQAQKQAKGQKLTQDQDTLDTWFSSALWTFSTLGWPQETPDFKKFHPTSVMETGYDIIFFWVARMIIMSQYLLKENPFETVYLHGIIRDKDGKKMSKSAGNGIDPIEMIDKFGTDALRLSLIIGSAPGADLRIYEEKIAGYRNFVNKLWNIARYILANTKNARIIDSAPAPKTLADQWILAETHKLISQVTDDLDNFRFSPAGEKIYDFSWNKLADWYLEIAKIEGNKDDILLYILQKLLILTHPFTPFVSEQIWQQFDQGLLMAASWPQAQDFDATVISDFSELRELVVSLRNLKAENKIPPTDFPDCYIENSVLDKSYLELAARLARVKLTTDKLDLEPLAIGSSRIWINLKKEMSAKEKQDLQKYIKGLEAQLKNRSFLDNAPAEVIEQTKKKLQEAQDKL